MKFIGGVLNAFRLGALGVIKTAVKNYYWFLLILVLLPKVVDTFQVAIETQNVLHPVIQLALHMFNADIQMGKDTLLLAYNRAELIGMVRPEIGLWNKMVYAWYFFKNVIWKFGGYLWVMAFPFVLLYKMYDFMGIKGKQSSKQQNVKQALISGVIVLIILNMAVVIYNLAEGGVEYGFTEEMSASEKIAAVSIYALPFHGTASFIKFLITGIPIKVILPIVSSFSLGIG